MKRNVFGQIFETSDKNEFLLFTRKNFYDSKDYGLSVMYTLNPYNWWMSMTNTKVFGYNFRISPIVSTNNRIKDGWAYFIYNRNSFLLNKKGNFRFELSFWYSSPSVAHFYNLSELYNLSTGLKYNPSKSLSLSLDINDVFSKSYPKLQSDIGGTHQNVVMKGYNSKRVNLSLSYSPTGKRNKKLKAKNNNQNQLDRLKRNGS